MSQRLKTDDRLSKHRQVTHAVEQRSTCKMLVSLRQAVRRDVVKHIHTNTGDVYCVPGTVQISAVGDR
jgi:hypothetical protein